LETLPKLRILLVEDSTNDAELIDATLRPAPFAYSLTRVETAADFTANLDGAPPDVILCDYRLPRFSMSEALQIVRAGRGLDTPFIVVSGHIGEEAAAEAIRNGANDYLLKGRLGRLISAIKAAVEHNESRRAKALGDAALQQSNLLNRSLLSSLPTRIAVLDPGGAILAVNGAWQRFQEQGAANRAPIAAGGNYLEFLRAIESTENWPSQQIREGIEAVIERRVPRFSLEYEAPSPSSPQWELIRAEPLADSAHGAVLSIENITARMLSHLALNDANRRLQVLSRQVLSVQEEERRAIALELHDDIGQSLAALKIALHNLGTCVDEREQRRVSDCVSITEEILKDVRRISYSLRPPQLDQFGLRDALHWLADQQQRATEVAIESRFSGDELRAHPSVEMACYRIAQEALNNAVRHARASQVVIELGIQGELMRLAIRDNGVGFDERQARRQALAAGSLGLISMSERAELAGGRLGVKTRIGGGTTVTAIFPMVEATRLPETAVSDS
jgi:signal transduction histidine kinase